MTQLRSCYFCGAVGDSLQEYEVVPERLVSPDGSRSAVLCSTCHEKLRRVLEPLAEAAETTPSPDRSADALDEVTFGSSDSADDADAAGETTRDADESETPADDESPERDADKSETDTVDADDSEASAAAELPDDYYKVLRLLQNREFPMERDALTGLVTGAYDVTEPECERILRTAVDRGVLVEDGSTVDIGRN